MKTLPINQYELIDAMLLGKFLELLREYGQDPTAPNFRRFITVDRRQIASYLKLHSWKALKYFEENQLLEATHDVAIIWKDHSDYAVGWMDHGHITDTKHFENLEEAEAYHLLLTYGKS